MTNPNRTETKIFKSIRDADTTSTENMQRFVDIFINKIYFYDDKKVIVLLNLTQNNKQINIDSKDLKNIFDNEINKENLISENTSHNAIKSNKKGLTDRPGSYKSNLAAQI